MSTLDSARDFPHQAVESTRHGLWQVESVFQPLALHLRSPFGPPGKGPVSLPFRQRHVFHTYAVPTLRTTGKS